MLRFTIRTKLTLILLVFGMLPLVAVMPLVFNKLHDMQKSTLEDMKITAESAGEIIDRNLFERYGDVQAFALNSAVRDTHSWYQQNSALVKAINGYMVNYGLYKLMMVVDINGKVAAVNSTNNKGDTLNQTTALYGKNFSTADWFQKTLRKEFLKSDTLNGTVVEQPSYNADVAAVYNEDGFTIPFAAPVYDAAGEVIGVWVNFADFGLVEDIVADVHHQKESNGAKNIAFAIGDEKGVALVNYDPAARKDAMKRDSSAIGKKSLESLEIPASGSLLRIATGTDIELDTGSGEKDAVSWVKSNGALGFPGLGWTVVVHQPGEYAFASILKAKHLLLVISGVALIVVLAVGALIGTLASKPIIASTKVTEALAGGDYSIDIKDKGNKDELGDLTRAMVAIRSTIADYSGQISAIGKSQAVIEFNLDGTIVTANENFLGALGYTLEEIKGKHHGMFVDATYRASHEYQQFWENLRNGHYQAGEFKRFGKNAKEIWIQASYNPILDVNGKPFKVVKYATDITQMVTTRTENEKGIAEAVDVLTGISGGNLTHRMEGEYKGTFADIKRVVNATVDKLIEIVTGIKEAAESVGSAANEIASGSSDLSMRTEQQASSLEETAASMEEITGTVKQNSANATTANELSTNASTIANEGGQVVKEAVGAMHNIEKSSQKISDIIGVIDEIAFQTNLLALNAAVEAARAGDAGKGFAVVASEVRALAGRSASASKEIKLLINESASQVKTGAELVNQAGETLTGIVTSVKQVANIVSEIASASVQQATGIDEINSAVTQMDETTQQNAALVEENTAAAQSMLEQAKGLEKLIGFFKVDTVQTETSAITQVKVEVTGKPATAKAKALNSKVPHAAVIARAQAVKAHQEEGWEEF